MARFSQPETTWHEQRDKWAKIRRDGDTELLQWQSPAHQFTRFRPAPYFTQFMAAPVVVAVGMRGISTRTSRAKRTSVATNRRSGRTINTSNAPPT